MRNIVIVGLFVAVAASAQQIDNYIEDLGQHGSQQGRPGVQPYVESGKCVDVTLKSNFNHGRYAGTWYMSYKMDNPFLGDIEKCISSEYNLNGAGFNVRTYGQSVTGQNIESVGEIKSTKEFPDASMSIFFADTFPANYRVIDTDYTSYSCVYSCTTTNNFKSEFGFVFSRTSEGAEDAHRKCGTSFLSNGINYAKLKATDMSCYGNAVTHSGFPSSNNDIIGLEGLAQQETLPNLPGVQSFVESGKCPGVTLQDKFSYQQYAGKWFMGYKMDNPFLGDVQKCIQSDYTVSGTGFSVRTSGRNFNGNNAEQIGEIKSTQEFPPASLSVFFPDTFPANYQVMETDYSSYSCVYSCTTTNNHKSEFGFVFSRTPEGVNSAWTKCGPSFLKNRIDFAKLKPTDMSCFNSNFNSAFTSADTRSYSPVPTSGRTTADTRAHFPVHTPDYTPVHAPAYTPVHASADTRAQALAHATSYIAPGTFVYSSVAAPVVPTIHLLYTLVDSSAESSEEN